MTDSTFPLRPCHSYGAASTPNRHVAPPLHALGNLWLNLLCMALAGYALFGKGWAYLGRPPLFVGEAVLLLGLIWLIASGKWRVAIGSPGVWPLWAYIAWSALCTIPHLTTYGVDTLRDAVLWSYGAYALIIYALLADRPDRLTLLWRRFRFFSLFFVAGILAVWLVCQRLGEALPRWPWADVPVIDAKGGDVLVHLAGVIAFLVAQPHRTARYARLAVLAAVVGLVGTHSRGGLVACLAALALCILLRPRNRTVWRFHAVCLCGLLLMAKSGLVLHAPPTAAKQRELSFQQLQANLFSVFGTARAGDLDDTKQWRLKWWQKIVNYTTSGPYFWTGKGYGINLADSDGFQGTVWDGRLRSPHSGHLTILARSGVPGFLLWVLLQVFWAATLWQCCRHSRRSGQHEWSGLFLFLLAYWAAFITNAAFDVFLEGPMGGVWFWTLMGTGLAAVRIYRSDPDALATTTPDGPAPLAWDGPCPILHRASGPDGPRLEKL